MLGALPRNSRLVSEPQSENAPMYMVATPLPTVTSPSLRHFSNDELATYVTLSGSTTLARLVQLPKDLFPILVTPLPITTLSSP